MKMIANHILKTTNLQKSFSGIIAAEDINISVNRDIKSDYKFN